MRDDKENKEHKNKKIYIIILIIFIIISGYCLIKCKNNKLIIPRYNHSAVELEDGRIFISGGETFIKGKHVILDSAEIYDPLKNKSVLIKEKMKQKRTTHGAVLLPGGDVLLIGGDGKKQTSEIYRIKTNSFEQAANLNYIRRDVLAVPYNNNIYIVDTFSPNIEVYDVNKNEFRYAGSFKKALRNTNEYVNLNGKLFFPIKSIELSGDSEISTINYFDTIRNEVGELKVQNNKDKDNIYIDCQNNAISKINNNLIQFCSTKNYIYAGTYNFKKQIFENFSNKLEIFGLNNLYPISSESDFIILGDIHSKKAEAVKYEILYDINNNQLSILRNYRKKYNKKSKILPVKNITYIIGGYYELPILGLKIVSKKIEVLK